LSVDETIRRSKQSGLSLGNSAVTACSTGNELRRAGLMERTLISNE